MALLGSFPCGAHKHVIFSASLGPGPLGQGRPTNDNLKVVAFSRAPSCTASWRLERSLQEPLT